MQYINIVSVKQMIDTFIHVIARCRTMHARQALRRGGGGGSGGGSVGSVDPPPLVRTSSACHQNNLFITSIHV